MAEGVSLRLGLALLPVLAFGLLFVYFFNRKTAQGVWSELIHTWIIFGAYLSLSLEFLSLFQGITLVGLVVAWMVPVALFVGWWIHRRRLTMSIQLPVITLPRNWFSWLLASMVFVVFLLTFLVAWAAPPQNWDSLTYHLSRVAHWAQNASLQHYSTGIERQNSMSPGAEMQVLVTYVLSGGDRLANLPSWFALVGITVVAAWCASLLGAQKIGQWAAAGYAATLPMAIIQASSASTDSIAAFWTVCALAQILSFWRTKREAELIYLGLAAGLAVLTKPTIIPFLFPFAVWVGIIIYQKLNFKGLLRWAVFGLILVLVLNVGYIGRNFLTYGNFSNPADFQVHSNQNRTPIGIFTTLVKNAGTQAGIPGQPWWTLQVFRFVVGLNLKLGLDVNDPRTTADGDYLVFSAPLIYEDRVINPYHAYLVLVLGILAVFRAKRLVSPAVLYFGLVISTMVLFSALFKWNTFGMRYHITFFVLFAPLAGLLLEMLCLKQVVLLAVIVLWLGSMPSLTQILTRPLIPSSQVSTPLIFTSSRADRQFSSAGLRSGYWSVVEPILKKSCTQVGLVLQGEDPEYLFWVLLGAPRKDLRIEWIVSGAPSQKYARADFSPCAVICKGCPPDQESFRSLPRLISNLEYQLFLQP